jgi:hypothetical protein
MRTVMGGTGGDFLTMIYENKLYPVMLNINMPS